MCYERAETGQDYAIVPAKQILYVKDCGIHQCKVMKFVTIKQNCGSNNSVKIFGWRDGTGGAAYSEEWA